MKNISQKVLVRPKMTKHHQKSKTNHVNHATFPHVLCGFSLAWSISSACFVASPCFFSRSSQRWVQRKGKIERIFVYFCATYRGFKGIPQTPTVSKIFVVPRRIFEPKGSPADPTSPSWPVPPCCWSPERGCATWSRECGSTNNVDHCIGFKSTWLYIVTTYSYKL